MKFKNVLFDLDGTLTESAPGIINSTKYALSEMGFDIPDDRVLEKFVGPPLVESFQKYCGMSASEAEEALKLYRVYFKDKGIFENSPYDGVSDMLKDLKNAGMGIYLATSKPEVFATRIIEHFCLSSYFDGVKGASMDGSFHEKKDVIAAVLRENALSAEDCVMIGDRLHDVRGAKACGVFSIGVLYGYGGEKELREAGADLVLSSPAEVVKAILGE